MAQGIVVDLSAFLRRGLQDLCRVVRDRLVLGALASPGAASSGSFQTL